jgi:hypothetical protein
MPHHQSIPMPVEYDIVIESADRTRVLIVECKRNKVTSAAEAANYRHSFHAFARDLTAAYFMMAFPTGLFLWKGDAAPDAPPPFSAAAKPVLKAYLGSVADQPGGPVAENLEIAISSWLNDLASGIREPDPDSEPEQLIVKSGLFDKLKGGYVRTHVAA